MASWGKILTSPKTALAFIGLAYVLQIGAIFYYSIPLPWGDEWDFLLEAETRFPDSISLSWLLLPHNEHFIVFTRLVNWISFKLTGWNYQALLVFNYGLFTFLLWLLYRSSRSSCSHQPAAVTLFFLFFLLTPAMAENHSWAFQSQFHIILIFFIANFVLLFDRTPTIKHFAVASFLAFFSPLCFSAAVPLVLAQWLGYSLLHLFRHKSISSPGYWLFTIASWLGVVIFLTIYTPNNEHVKTLPSDPLFWEYLFAFVGHGLGIRNTDLVINIFGTIVVIAPALIFLIKFRDRFSDATVWKVISTLMAVVGIAMITSYGRSYLGLHQSKSSRYLQIAALLAVSTYWGYSYILANTAMVRTRDGLLSLWVLLAIFFFDGWDYGLHYRYYNKIRQPGLPCIASYYAYSDDAFCTSIYPEPIGKALDFAKSRNLQIYNVATSYDQKDKPQ